MKNFENKLIEGFKSVELEERLEMVHLTALTESSAMSITSDVEQAEVQVSVE
jgi:hypothetical protein